MLGGLELLICREDFSGGAERGRNVTSDRKDPADLQEVNAHRFSRGLGLFDSTMIVAGSMIGSAIFIVSADMSRQLGSSGWLLLSWVVAGVLTITAALSYGELASMMPQAGGQYVYLRESFSPTLGFLYGWTLFLIIQTGTVAAVAIGFARFLGVLWLTIGESHYIIEPVHVTSGYAISLSTAQLVAVLVILLLTWSNTRGLNYGKVIQNVFTTSKIAALVGLIVAGILFGRNAAAIHANFSALWSPSGYVPIAAGIGAATGYGLFVALCVSQVGSLFAADAWNNITFTAGEVKNPRRNIPLSLALGSGMVIGLYLLVNLAYLFTLPLNAIQHAESDRVATATLQAVFPGLGVTLMALAIMVSTFGCINGMLLTGSRAYYAMARDGLFFKRTGILNRAGVPGVALIVQGVWAAFLVLPRTYDPLTGKYGNLYSNLLDYVVSAVLIFYILTIIGIFRLRRTKPLAERPYKTFGYPVVPALYIVGASVILVVLLCYRTSTTLPGLVLIASGLPVYILFRAVSRRGTENAPSEKE
jgi:basic amino acid/polyamine antiporter, APA family